MSGCVLLLSGGVDSAALAAWLRPDQTLTIDYGQVSAQGEVNAARAIARRLELPWATARVDCSSVGSGLLAGRVPDPLAPAPEWWPYRNQLLVTIAAAWALPRDFDEILVGSVATDARHRDGTLAFYELLDRLMSLQEGAVRVRAPAIACGTLALVKRAQVPAGILGFTHSCHEGPVACGLCPGCSKRERVLQELGLA